MAKYAKNERIIITIVFEYLTIVVESLLAADALAAVVAGAEVVAKTVTWEVVVVEVEAKWLQLKLINKFILYKLLLNFYSQLSIRSAY